MLGPLSFLILERGKAVLESLQAPKCLGAHGPLPSIFSEQPKLKPQNCLPRVIRAAGDRVVVSSGFPTMLRPKNAAIVPLLTDRHHALCRR
jgi:hypothetical protein